MSFHIVLDSPHGTVFPSFPSTALGKDAEAITLAQIRQVFKVFVNSVPLIIGCLELINTRSKKYMFSIDGKSQISDSTTLKYYISVTPEASCFYSIT